MICPYCKSKNISVKDSREATNNRIRRRRICFDCGEKFTTFEISSDDLENLDYFRNAFDEIKDTVKKWG